MADYSNDNILSPLDRADLLAQGLAIFDPAGGGTFRLHKRRLNQYSEQEYKSIPLVVTQPTSPEVVSESFVSLPELLTSYETLIHIGFTTTRATELWTQWTNWPSEAPDRDQYSFKEWIMSNFDNRDEPTDENETLWRRCLEDCGINVEPQDAILDPRYEQICFSNSCLFWAMDTVDMRFAGLEEIQRTSQRRELQIQQQGASRPGGQAERTTYRQQ